MPGGLLTKVGKMRAAFGKVNTLHNHILTWTDRPLVTQNLVGGEDGIDDAGISVARLIPNPWIFLEATGQMFNGTAGEDQAGTPLFKSTKRSELSYVAHLRGYHDLTENANIDLGFSYSHGHNGLSDGNAADPGSLVTQLYGIDATYRCKPLARSVYHSFVGRAEYIWSERDQPAGLQSATGFSCPDYQVGRRWFTGVRLRSLGARHRRVAHRYRRLVHCHLRPSRFQPVRALPPHQLQTAPSIIVGATTAVPVSVLHRRARHPF